jgi:intein/homing endonuclease
VFKKGAQRMLLQEFLVSKKLTQSGGSKFFGIAPRSFSDWLREKTKIPQLAYNQIPKSIQTKYRPISTVDQYWYTKKGSHLGYKKVIEKYGEIPKNETRRKTNWLKWWNNEGHKNNKIIGQTKPAKIPNLSNELAELVGILLGDGGIQKYQIKISLNHTKDKEYSKYITKLIYKLFGLKTGSTINKKESVEHLYISRKEVVSFLESIGLKTSNKTQNQVGVPDWIKENIEYAKYCIRGLFDTDGCVVVEKHRIKTKEYSYPRLNFTNSSNPLIRGVFDILTTLNMEPKIRRLGKAVQVENFNKICDYMATVGSSNPRILNRWLNIRRDV